MVPKCFQESSKDGSEKGPQVRLDKVRLDKVREEKKITH